MVYEALLQDATNNTNAKVYKYFYRWAQMEALSRSVLEDGGEYQLWMSRLVESLLEQGSDIQLKEASNLLERMQDNPSVIILKGLLYCRTDQLDKCSAIIDSFEDKLAIGFLLLRGEYLMKTGHFEESVHLLDKLCAENPKNADVLLNSAKIIWKKPEERHKCIAYLLTLIKIKKNIEEPYIMMGDFYDEQWKDASCLQRAVRCFENAFRLNQHNAETYQKLVNLHLKNDDINSAIKVLEVVILKNPIIECIWAWQKKGLLHSIRRKEHLKVVPGEGNEFYERKRIAYERNNYDDNLNAILCFQKVLRITN